MDSRSLGSSRNSGKKRLPLPSAKQQQQADGDDLLSIISGDPSTAINEPVTDEIDLLSHFSSDSLTSQRKTRSKPQTRKPGSLLLGSTTGPSGDHYETKSAKSGSMKSNKSRKKLPLPSQMDSQDMLSSFMTNSEPNSTSSVLIKKKQQQPSMAPKFGLDGNEHELLERLSNISSQSSKSKTRNLPRPSNTLQTNDDLLSYITNDTGQFFYFWL